MNVSYSLFPLYSLLQSYHSFNKNLNANFNEVGLITTITGLKDEKFF